MSEREVLEVAKANGNAQADQYNQWEELGCDEKLGLVARAALQSPPNPVVVTWMTEDGERVITDTTKRTLPRAVQAPYTVPVVQTKSGDVLAEGDR